jgi:hypothetical protein
MIFDGGLGDSVEVTEDGVRIRRKGLKGLISQGLKRGTFYPFASISSVQFKEAGATDGFIRFSVPGTGSLGVPDDENSVAFAADRAGDFRALRDLVQQRISSKASASVAPVPAPASAAPKTPMSAAPMSAANVEELSRLADLKDRGVITEEEFAAQKQALLSAPAAAAIPVTVQVTSANAAPAPEQPIGYDMEIRRDYGCGKPIGIGCLGLLILAGVGQLLALCTHPTNVARTTAGGNVAAPASQSGTPQAVAPAGPGAATGYQGPVNTGGAYRGGYYGPRHIWVHNYGGYYRQPRYEHVRVRTTPVYAHPKAHHFLFGRHKH